MFEYVQVTEQQTMYIHRNSFIITRKAYNDDYLSYIWILCLSISKMHDCLTETHNFEELVAFVSRPLNNALGSGGRLA